SWRRSWRRAWRTGRLGTLGRLLLRDEPAPRGYGKGDLFTGTPLPRPSVGGERASPAPSPQGDGGACLERHLLDEGPFRVVRGRGGADAHHAQAAQVGDEPMRELPRLAELGPREEGPERVEDHGSDLALAEVPRQDPERLASVDAHGSLEAGAESEHREA